MSKTILYRLFGFGKIPKDSRPILEREGIVLLDEGIGGWVIFRNFKAPGRRYHRKRTWFSGSLVLTDIRFVAFTFRNPIINVALNHEKLKELHCSLRKDTVLCVSFDPSAFNEKWSGYIECRFSTPQAGLYLEHLQARIG